LAEVVEEEVREPCENRLVFCLEPQNGALALVR
jgi:hypothetical protein